MEDDAMKTIVARLGTPAHDQLLARAQRGEKHLYAIHAVKMCEGPRGSSGRQQRSMLVRAPTKEKAIAAVKKVIRPHARRGDVSCRVKIDAYGY